jgi:hypothetical protein
LPIQNDSIVTSRWGFSPESASRSSFFEPIKNLPAWTLIISGSTTRSSPSLSANTSSAPLEWNASTSSASLGVKFLLFDHKKNTPTSVTTASPAASDTDRTALRLQLQRKNA